MRFNYENEDTTAYLVYELSQEDELDSLSFGMLTNNRIQGIASLFYTQMNDKKFLKYNISSKVSMRQLFTVTINKKRLLVVLSSIISAIIASQDYMIEVSSLVLDMDYIFVDVATNEVNLICLPILHQEERKVELSYFFKTIMFQTQFDSSENCDYVAKIITFLNSASSISLSSFLKILTECQMEDGKQLTDSSELDNEKTITETEINLKRSGAPQPKVEIKETKVIPSVPRPVVSSQPRTIPPVASQPIPQQVSYTLNQVLSSDTQTGLNQITYPPNQSQVIPTRVEPVSQVPNQAVKPINPASQPAKTDSEVERPSSSEHKKKEKKGKKDKTEKKGFHLFGKSKKKAESENAPATDSYTNETAAANMVGNGQFQQIRTPSFAQVNQMYSPMPMQNHGYGGVNYGEATVLNGAGAGETTVLDAISQEICPYLLRMKTNEKVMINKPVFRIGKERSYVDCFISDNSAVSRNHASIVLRDGECYLIDTNSTNHTFINGMMISSNVEMKLSNGMKVRFANEEFEFRNH